MTDKDMLASLGALADALKNFPADVKVEVTVDIKIHDDPPDGYVETSGGSGYQKIVDARGGLVTKSITITFPE